MPNAPLTSCVAFRPKTMLYHPLFRPCRPEWPCSDAFSSQALISYVANTAKAAKCLYCRIGHRYLAGKSHTPADK